MTVYAITDTKRENRIAPTYLQVGAGAAGAAFSNTVDELLPHSSHRSNSSIYSP